MQGSNKVRRRVRAWPLALAVIAIVTAPQTFGAVSRAFVGDADAPAQGIEAQQARALTAASEVKGARVAPVTPTATPELIDTLRAAVVLIDAGAMREPPPLIESLRAAVVLVDAGAMPEPPDVTEARARRAWLVVAAQNEAALRTWLLVAVENEARLAGPQPAPAPRAVVRRDPPATVVPSSPPSATVASTDAQLAGAVLSVLNARRANAGLGALAPETRLTSAAERYASVLSARNWFSHTGPDGSTFVDRVTAAGYPFNGALGEVLALAPSADAGRIVDAWMASPGHRDQILRASFRFAGVGCAVRSGDVRCVAEFAE